MQENTHPFPISDKGGYVLSEVQTVRAGGCNVPAEGKALLSWLQLCFAELLIITKISLNVGHTDDLRSCIKYMVNNYCKRQQGNCVNV